MASKKRKNKIPLNIVQKKGLVSKHLVDVRLSQAQTHSGAAHCTTSPTLPQSGSSLEEPNTVQHNERLHKQSMKWKELAPSLFKALVEESAGMKGHSADCMLCGKAPAPVRCKQCGPNVFVCFDCGIQLHSAINHHHFPEIWKEDENCFLPLSLPVPQLRTHTCDSSSRHERTVVCFHIEGPPQKLSVSFCQCEPDVVTLARLNYWPATPSRPSTAFSFSLLDWLQALLLESQVPVSSFSRAFKLLITSKYIEMPCSIYPVLIEAFEVYRSTKAQIDRLQGICDLEAFSTCPACPKGQGSTLTISIDANFGLCRKKASGKSVYDAKNGMFVDQEEVDHYIAAYSTKSKGTDACNNFLAGHMLRSNSRYSALDETGVMGAVCRHEHPVPCFLNLRHGERIAYSVYVCERLRQLFPYQKIQLMYDIGCSLEKHLKANGRMDVLEYFKFAVPVFHAYGHESACQVVYNPRNITGFGLSDGECVERLWAYMRRFAAMTKEMHPSHRVNVLSDALVYYGQKSAKSLFKLLPKRLKRAKKVKEDATKELQQLLDSSPEQISGMDVANWAKEEKAIMSKPERTTNDLDALYRMAKERWFLLRLKSKYAAGQAIANRLSRRINVVSKALKSALNKYNSNQSANQRLSWVAVTNLSSDNQLNGIPRSFQYQVIRLYHSVARGEEEIFRLLSEMRNTIEHYLQKFRAICTAIEIQSKMGTNFDTYQYGVSSLLFARKRQCVSDLVRLGSYMEHGEFPELSQFLSSVCNSERTSDHEGCSDSRSFECSKALNCKTSDCNLDQYVDGVYCEVLNEGSDSEDDDISESEGNYCEDDWQSDNDYSDKDDANDGAYCEDIGLCNTMDCEDDDHGAYDEDNGHGEDDISSSKEKDKFPETDSDGEMEVQHWRKQKLFREEYIQSTLKPATLDDKELALLHKVQDTSGTRKSPNTNSGFLSKPQQELKRITDALSFAAKRMKQNKLVDRGPLFKTSL